LVCFNVDAAIFAAEHRMGLRVVIRDHLGDLKLACSEGIPIIMSHEMAEAIAIRRALLLARGNGFRHVILASEVQIASP
jgi:hypothetical protein